MYRKFLNYKNIRKKKLNYFHQKINFIFILNYRKIEKFLMKNLLLSKNFMDSIYKISTCPLTFMP